MSTSIDGVIACATYLLAISAGAQGFTETLKNAMPWLMVEKAPLNPENQDDISAASKLEGYRQGALKIMATLSAMALIWLAEVNPIYFLTGSGAPLNIPQIVAWGMVSSFGSPFLNQILKILISIRDTRNALINKKSPIQRIGSKKNQAKSDITAAG